jgi:hypothetical protein
MSAEKQNERREHETYIRDVGAVDGNGPDPIPTIETGLSVGNSRRFPRSKLQGRDVVQACRDEHRREEHRGTVSRPVEQSTTSAAADGTICEVPACK